MYVFVWTTGQAEGLFLKGETDYTIWESALMQPDGLSMDSEICPMIISS